ncbi:hypothetical protein OAK75_00435 [Bacteriovoracales bacterium]|nr:hypothetical protein [Bacteriovoracales bacterium]
MEMISKRECLISYVFMFGLSLVLMIGHLGKVGGGHAGITKSLLNPGDYDYFFVRTCDRLKVENSLGNLELRKRMRWVWKSFEINFYKFIHLNFGNRVLSFFHQFFYASLIFFNFLFIKKANFLIFKDKDKKYFYYIFFSFFIFALYTLGPGTPEIYFSIIESLCISACIYAILKKNVFLYLVACLFATLNRESGALLGLFWFLFYPKDVKSFFYIIIPPSVLFLVNLDIMGCMLDYNSLFAISPQEGQLIITDPTSYTMASLTQVFFKNFLVFLVPVFALREFVNDKFLKKILYIFLFYQFVFFIGTTLDHLSSKFMLAPLMITLCIQAIQKYDINIALKAQNVSS